MHNNFLRYAILVAVELGYERQKRCMKCVTIGMSTLEEVYEKRGGINEKN